MFSSIRSLLRDALRAIGAPEDAAIVLDVSRNEGHGDLSTPVAFSLAGHFGRSPRSIAEEIVRHLPAAPEGIAEATIAGGGFINIRCTPEFYHRSLENLPDPGKGYLRSDTSNGPRALIRSSAPTADPSLPLGRYRDAVLCETIALLLRHTGHQVTHEQTATPGSHALTVELFGSGTATASTIRTVPHQSVLLLNEGAPWPRTASPPATGDLLAEFGADMVRFFLLMRPAGIRPLFDLDLARRHSERNPLRYLQYASARIAGLLRHAAAESLPLDERADLSPLRQPEELALVRQILLFPQAVSRAARGLEPATLADSLRDLVSAFGMFHRQCRIIAEPPPLQSARLRLLAATGRTLAAGLGLLGISAPERV